MSFNPDPIKQAKAMIFSRKISQGNHPGLMFNNSIVNVTSIQQNHVTLTPPLFTKLANLTKLG